MCTSSSATGFQSTLPAWGETSIPFPFFAPIKISIHSPRMGRDMADPCLCRASYNFNPLSPHGERPSLQVGRWWSLSFQSTLPAWGETKARGSHAYSHAQKISIHSPRMGRDCRKDCLSRHTRRFQSTLPAWGETVALVFLLAHIAISIHSPRMGRDSRGGEDMMEELISIHSPRMGRDPFPSGCSGCPDYFNPLSPHGERHSGRERSRP